MNNYESFLVIWKRWEESTHIPSAFWAPWTWQVFLCLLSWWQIDFIMHTNSYCLVSFSKMLMQKCNSNNDPCLSGRESGILFESLIKVRDQTKVELFIDYVSHTHSEPSIKKHFNTGTGLGWAALCGWLLWFEEMSSKHLWLKTCSLASDTVGM